jgi:hypothetical protein
MLNTLSNLERSAFLTAGNKGNTGATGAVPVYSQQVLEHSSIFKVIPSAPYNNAYWYLRLIANQPDTVINAMVAATKLSLGLKFKIKESDFDATRCVEFEAQQVNDGYLFNFAWQVRVRRAPNSSPLRIYNYAKKAWEATPFAMIVRPDFEHHIFADYSRTPVGTVHKDINIDGTSFTLGLSHTKVDTRKYDPNNPNKVLSMSHNTLNVGFQLDTQAGYYTDVDKDGTKEFHGSPAIAEVRDFNLKYGD